MKAWLVSFDDYYVIIYADTLRKAMIFAASKLGEHWGDVMSLSIQGVPSLDGTGRTDEGAYEVAVSYIRSTREARARDV